MAASITLSVFDPGLRTAGESARATILSSVNLAQHREGLGYRRYWPPEPHAKSVAWAGPTPVVSIIASQTRKISVGPAGVLPEAVIAVAGTCRETDQEACDVVSQQTLLRVACSVFGSSITCRELIGRLCRIAGVDEVVFLDISSDADARLGSLTRLADAFTPTTLGRNNADITYV
jgi:hypothetical protein